MQRSNRLLKKCLGCCLTVATWYLVMFWCWFAPSNPPPSRVIASSQSAGELPHIAFPTALPGVMASAQLAGDLAFPTSLPKVAAYEQVGGATVSTWPVVDRVLDILPVCGAVLNSLTIFFCAVRHDSRCHCFH